MKRRQLSVLVLGVMAIAGLRPAHADDSILYDHGKTVSPQQTTDITMLEENVEITVRDLVYKTDSSFPFPSRMAHVKCVFTFFNSSNIPVVATVGFPGDLAEEGNYIRPLADFVAVVDGQPQPVSVKEEKVPGVYPPVRSWYTWAMTFPPGTIVTVENRYVHELSGYDPFALTYEMSTGANWKGPIGKATVRVIYGSVREMDERVCGIDPPGWTREGAAIVWRFTDLEPTTKDNIRVCERNVGIEVPEDRREPRLFPKK